jgi:hypothetical protein
MSNVLTILLLATNWLGQPIPCVQVNYETTGAFALKMSRDLQEWQMVVQTTNDWPQRGSIIMPRIDRAVFKLVPPCDFSMQVIVGQVHEGNPTAPCSLTDGVCNGQTAPGGGAEGEER